MASIRIRFEMAAWQFLLDENVDPKVATYLGKEDWMQSTFETRLDRVPMTKRTSSHTLLSRTASS